MKYLLLIMCCSPMYSALPPIPELVVQPSSSGSSSENVVVEPIERSPRKESGLVLQRKAFFDGKKGSVVYRRDSALSEYVVTQAQINNIRGVRRPSTMAAAAAYLNAARILNNSKDS